MQPVQINNESEETVEISAAEYKAVMEFSVAISEQNAVNQEQTAALQEAMQTMRAEMIAQAENQTAVLASFMDRLVEAIAGLNIVVNVPPQPAPVVNMPAPKVTIQEPADGPKKSKVKINRNTNGAITSMDVVTE